MTREELEEGRRLFRAFEEFTIRSTGNPRRALSDWLVEHAAELLSLAEEARWRDVETELPPDDTYVQIWDGQQQRLHPYFGMRTHGRWSHWCGGPISSPSHWRPLPKGPK